MCYILMRQLIGNVLGQKCYKALCVFDKPCENCTAFEKLDINGKYSISEEHYNPKTKHYYRASECIIDWIDGRKARMTMAITNF